MRLHRQCLLHSVCILTQAPACCIACKPFCGAESMTLCVMQVRGGTTHSQHELQGTATGPVWLISSTTTGTGKCARAPGCPCCVVVLLSPQDLQATWCGHAGCGANMCACCAVLCRVNGMDVLAVKQACQFAREHAAKHGPVIIEADTYRWEGWCRKGTTAF